MDGRILDISMAGNQLVLVAGDAVSFCKRAFRVSGSLCGACILDRLAVLVNLRLIQIAVKSVKRNFTDREGVGDRFGRGGQVGQRAADTNGQCQAEYQCQCYDFRRFAISYVNFSGEIFVFFRGKPGKKPRNDTSIGKNVEIVQKITSSGRKKFSAEGCSLLAGLQI